MTNDTTKVSDLVVRCLEEEGVHFVFGIPGEENLDFIESLGNSTIRVIVTRHEQGASFMADTYGRLTGKAGVCFATLGPGAVNLQLGVANAFLDSHPVVAIAAQASLGRTHKESHQVLDLVSLFRPMTKWTEMIALPENVAEILRKAFKRAQSGRPGPVTLVVPEDVGGMQVQDRPLPVNKPTTNYPNPIQIDRAVKALNQAQHPVVLAGAGVFRHKASTALIAFAEALKIPVATTFLGKGVIPADHECCIGALGFMRHDYANFGFDHADLVITVGYDLVEYPPKNWNPGRDKSIIHIHDEVAEVDKYYSLSVGIEGDIAASLDQIAQKARPRSSVDVNDCTIRDIVRGELSKGEKMDDYPLKPQRIIADVRKALGREDILLCDTGALKMWASRLYPAYAPDTCLISNGLSTMGWALPGALGAKLARPRSNILAMMGDGSYLMNAQEIETALREEIPFVILVWVDEHYGLIKWKQELDGHPTQHVSFTNPDFVKHAESYGAKGYHIQAAEDLLPTLKTALAENTVSVIACPVDYSENAQLIKSLGGLSESM